MGEVWGPWRLLGASFWGEVTSLKLPSQKNEVLGVDLEGFWLNLEAPGSLWGRDWGPAEIFTQGCLRDFLLGQLWKPTGRRMSLLLALQF